MNVTSVKFNVFKPKEHGNCAEATVIFDNELAVHRVSVIKGKKGYFVAMPHTSLTRSDEKQRYDDLVHPISSEFRERLSLAVLEAFYARLK